MLATLKWLLELDKSIPGSGGLTYRQSHEKALKDRKMEWAVKEAELKMTPPPFLPVEEAAVKAGMGEDAESWVTGLFAIFLELSRQRARGQTVCPLSFTDINSYQIVNNFEFHHLELQNILAMDGLFTETVTEMADQQIQEARQKAGA